MEVRKSDDSAVAKRSRVCGYALMCVVKTQPGGNKALRTVSPGGGCSPLCPGSAGGTGGRGGTHGSAAEMDIRLEIW